MRHVLALVLIVLAFGPGSADAQVVNISGYTIRARTQDRISDKQGLLVGSVELERGDTMIYADQVEYFEDEDRALATGNVVFTQGNNRIAAERAEFNTRSGLGTFFDARGFSSMQPPRLSTGPSGIAVPTQMGQDTDVYFFGEVIEKLGPKKYKITNGGFSTCVQPTPRWDLTAGTVVLNVDDYTLLKNAIFRVKNVPVFYVPAFYYPTQEDGRATGILLPTYSSSNFRGQTISNAFFWAINRSSDATVLFDWFSRTGTGAGLEYRYALARGSGSLTAYQLNQRETTFLNTGGGETTLAAAREYTVRGSLNHTLPGNFRATANVDYFSSLITNQTFNTNINNVAANTSTYGGNIAGSWQSMSLNATFNRREQFASSTNSFINGRAPSVALSRSERPLFTNAPIFFGFTADASQLENIVNSDDGLGGTVTNDRSVGRIDFTPRLRYPFKRWQWFTVSSSLEWRETFYTRSQDPLTNAVNEANLNRQFFTVGAQAVGPTFNRIWNPTNGYAERFKHTIEPFLNVGRTSLIDQRERILVVDGTDQIFGGTTTISYGINNRLYAKRKMGMSPTSQAIEILSLGISQTYFSNAAASTVDPTTLTGNTTTVPSNYGPLKIDLRARPGQNIGAQAYAEFDGRYQRLRSVSVSGDYNVSERVRGALSYTKRFFIAELPFYNDPTTLAQAINLSSNIKTLDNKYGTNYSLNYDILQSTLVQQQITAFYNAQCCGLALQYQRQNFPAGFILPSDNRFFLSFTLAGLGNFSPMNGGLGGIPR